MGLAVEMSASDSDRTTGTASVEIGATLGKSPLGGKNRIRVLLADDHKLLRESFARLLREEPDIDVISEASDGEMAVEQAKRMQPDVVLIDVGMPRLDGIEATRQITAELTRVRVIGLSMHEQEHMADALMQAGAVAYLRKDGPFDLLVSTVRGRSSEPANAVRPVYPR